MTDERGEFVEWRFWRFPQPERQPPAFRRRDRERDRAAAKCSTSSPRCSVFLEKRPAAVTVQDESSSNHQHPEEKAGIAPPSEPVAAFLGADDAAKADDSAVVTTDSFQSKRSHGASQRDSAPVVSVASDWRRIPRPNRVGRLLRDAASAAGDASAAEGGGCGHDDAHVSVAPSSPLKAAAAAPVGDAMGNKSSSSSSADKRAKGSSDCLSETPKGSPGLFRLGRDVVRGKVRKTPQPARKAAAAAQEDDFAVAPGKCQGTESHAVVASANGTPKKRSESSPESSVSGSVYVDTVSHLAESEDGMVVAGDASTSRTAASLESVEVGTPTTPPQRSPSNASDTTVFGEEVAADFVFPQPQTPPSSAPVTANGAPVTTTGVGGLPSYRTSGLRVRSHSEADSTTLLYTRAPSCTSLGRGDANKATVGSDATAAAGYAAPTFTLTQHRKVVLPKFSAPSSALSSAAAAVSEESGDAKPGSAQVASLTLERAAIEAKVNRPKVVPEKLDFSIYEKFEGQMLLNWFCTTFPEDHYLRFLLTKQDLKLLAAQFCTHLLAAGVLRQIEDENAPLESLFRPDLMYYWTHSEVPACPVSNVVPGKLTTDYWPPPDSEGDARPGLRYTEAEAQQMVMGLKKAHRNELEKLQKEHELALFSLRGEQAARLTDYEGQVVRLEQEIDKYQTLAGIEELTRKARDIDAPQATPAPARIAAAPVSQRSCEVQTLSAVLRSCEAQTVTRTRQEYTTQESQTHVDTCHQECQTDEQAVPPTVVVTSAGSSSTATTGGWHSAYATARKQPVNPKALMKPLYWTRIQVPSTKQPQGASPASPEKTAEHKTLWEVLEETPPSDWEEFENLFSRQVQEKKPTAKTKSAQEKTKQVAKLLDQKRSQNVGILISSLRLEICDVENVMTYVCDVFLQPIYNFDTSVVSLDTLQALYEIRPTSEELKLIQDHLALKPEVPLDKPERFLLDLSRIPEYADRVGCIMFQSTYTESISIVENKLNNLKMTCEALLHSKEVRTILGLILALGNYMNGGNRSRGQADGFGLEILAKLKDVKSKDNSLTLLHYIVRVYISKFQEDVSQEKAKFPLPEPTDMERAGLVNFDDIRADLKKLDAQIKSCETKVQKVLENSDSEHQEPFREQMTTFLQKAHQEQKEQEENLEETRLKFPGDQGILPPAAQVQERNIWKKEVQRKIKLDLEAARKKVKDLQEAKKSSVMSEVVKVRSSKPSGLKAKMTKRMQQLGQSFPSPGAV
ncbi:hypothetical protein MTO96_029814 [Rhipicephalus appendiculatus]